MHKTADDQVLLTDGVRLAEHRFLVAARWPHNHLLYYPSAGPAGDPTLLLESARQAAAYISHRFYDIPQARHPFVLTSMSADIKAPGLPYDAAAPLRATLDITCTPTTTAPRRFGMRLEATLLIDGQTRGRVHLAWEALPARLYTILRLRNCPPHPGNSPQPPAADAPSCPRGAQQMTPAVAGRRHVRDVLLSTPAGTTSSTLLLDPGHPVYFDHPDDHIPGMVLFEAMRQAAHATAWRPAAPSQRWTPLSMETTYHLFADFDSPVTFTVTADTPLRHQQPTRLHVAARQRGAALCELRLGTRPLHLAATEKEMTQC